MLTQNDEKLFVRQDWIGRMSFHAMSDREVMTEAVRRVTQARAKSQRNPIVILDLDSTLYEVRTRTHKILREWCDSKNSGAFPRARDRILQLEFEHLNYSIRDLFSFLDTSENHDAIFESIKNFWQPRFFTNDYLEADFAYPGAARWVQSLHELGAEIVYLTGRDEPGMGTGTRANLVRDGFPWDTSRTHLLLKKTFDEPDLDHKKNAAAWIQERGEVIASLENEPPNLIALAEAFPSAMNVFVETICSTHPAPIRSGFYRLKNFENWRS
jgi:phosphoglycolate phosphatase-like HAD superfamily hydrolase